MIVDFFPDPSFFLLFLSSSSDLASRFELGPHGEPFVYCRTNRFPRIVRSDDCCLVLCQHWQTRSIRRNSPY
jgi:hypothetical protein